MQQRKRNKRVFFGLHLYRKPEATAFYSSLKYGARLLKEHGYEVEYGLEMFDPYIQKARNELAAKFLRSDCDIFVFVADDLEYKPSALLKLVETEGEVVCGAYLQKQTAINYPVVIFTEDIDACRPIVREDGCIMACRVQTGFLRIDRSALEKITEAHPELSYYSDINDIKFDVKQDFFPQGVHNHKWIGEDYAFCDMWRALGGEIWIIPDLDLTHWQGKDENAHKGNYHEHLMRLPGGCREAEGKIERVMSTRDQRPPTAKQFRQPGQSLQPLLDALPIKNATMVELGSYTGESIEIFHKSGKFKTLTAVDPWIDGYDSGELISTFGNMDVVEELFDRRMEGVDSVNKLKMTSMEAVRLFEDKSLDFIYIDAAHTYGAVREDILSWLPKMKPGSFVAGHDYELYEGVRQAVDEIFGSAVMHFPDSSWMIELKIVQTI